MKYLSILAISLFFISCSSATSSESKYDPPADHTISKSGAMHKPGLDTALDNCVSCHGADLLGGNVGVSCYECHSQKWNTTQTL